MPFGMHKGREISELPRSYLRWLRRTIKSGRVAEEVAWVLSGGLPPVDPGFLTGAWQPGDFENDRR
jgi:hypothetical protein